MGIADIRNFILREFNLDRSESSYLSDIDWIPVQDSKHFLEVHDDKYRVKLDVDHFLFNVEIHSTEDKADNDSAKAIKDPVVFISEFLTADSTSIFPHISSYERISQWELAKKIASEARSRLPYFLPSLRNLVSSIFKSAKYEEELLELAKLKSTMKDNGWTVKVTTEPDEWPQIEVNISDEFEAKIDVEEAVWRYEFTVLNSPSSMESGTTNDPVAKFQKYIKSSKTKELVSEEKLQKKIRNIEEDFKPTKRP